MRKTVCMMLMFFGLFQVTSALAITLDFSPSMQTVLVGQPVSVDVIVSGVGRPPSVGGYDIDVSFDPAVLSPTGVTFGLFLGDPALGEALTSFTFPMPGVVDFAEVSLLTPAELDALQPDSFRLATLSFNATAVGTVLMPPGVEHVFRGYPFF